MRAPIDPALIEQSWLIDTADGPRRYVEIRDPWQAADDAALMPAVRKVVGLPNPEPPRLKAYLERARGHDKTGTLARLAATMLISSPRQIVGSWVAAKLDQAQLGRHAIERLCLTNPKAGELLDVQQYRVVSKETGSRLDFLSSDGPTQFGRTDDFIVADELTVWPDEKGEDLWGAIFSSIPKRGAFCCVITNAGFDMGNSWQWKARESFRQSPECYFSSQAGCVASWISKQELAFQQRTLAGPVYLRVWENQWLTEGQGDSLDRATINACCTLSNPHPCRLDHFGAYVISGDLGWVQDHSALVTLAVDQWTGLIHVANVESWTPEQHGGQVNFDIVEEAIVKGVHKYNADYVLLDASQAIYMAQRLARRGINAATFAPSSKLHQQMATAMLTLFRNKQIAMYPHHELCRDLGQISIVEKSNGLHVNALRTSKGGHCDRGMALLQGLPLCLELMGYLREPAEAYETALRPL